MTTNPISPNLGGEEDTLFDEWSKAAAFEADFVRDGAPYPARYSAARVRVLLLLKEPFASKGGWDLRAGLRDELKTGQTWNNASRWVRALSALPDSPAWSTVADQNTSSRRESLATVAVANMKKVIGRSRTRPAEVHAFVSENRAYLRRQFALYHPHVTLLCGTAPFIGHLYSQEEQGERQVTGAGVSYRCGPVLGCMLRFYHPQTSASTARVLYETLAAGATEAYQRCYLP